MLILGSEDDFPDLAGNDVFRNRGIFGLILWGGYVTIHLHFGSFVEVEMCVLLIGLGCKVSPSPVLTALGFFYANLRQ